MKEVEFLVVGLGIAGISFCERLLRSQKDFVALDGPKMAATQVAGGIVNPVVLKRVTAVWNATSFLEEALPFYDAIGKRLKTDFYKETEILRIFAGAEEQNEWLVASGSQKLASFIDPEIKSNPYEGLKAPNGLGEVKKALQLNTNLLLDAYRSHVSNAGKFISEAFQYDRLTEQEDGWVYGDVKAKYVVFAEGASVVQNPFFNVDAVIPKKGEYITIKADTLQIDKVIKGPFFVIPLGDDLYKIGATFAHGDTSHETTEKGREQLLSAVNKMIDGPFKLVAQEVGMRPTVKDRKPLLGSVSNNRIYFFNGLGTRGLLMAPLLSQMLWNHIENELPLPAEVDIRRFSSDRT
ncbi:FAD-dependent oxidoreductase [Aureisphaera galaxeae]|uniref:NAD(P)/FAD-dependent oxidoreductase n=1 Tax=Aureisphaera galaxeae TaxID=1538023 RepID=UPI002350B00F|nr:FAD-dependent oxidoreductase [Aureisphaera galaxeae]MDC8003085.1 FAD-dependent oxidoreductase [Aureisphaera galaxeae]